MDWTDYYSENCADTPTNEQSMKVFDSIVELWIQFSVFEISLHQFKKAVEVFEKAIIDPIGCKSKDIFLAYARFCVDRNKLANAQNVYIKGLCAGLCANDNITLWDNFLALMHTVNKSKDLTLAQLYDAVKNQKGVDVKVLAAPVLTATGRKRSSSTLSDSGSGATAGAAATSRITGATLSTVQESDSSEDTAKSKNVRVKIEPISSSSVTTGATTLYGEEIGAIESKEDEEKADIEDKERKNRAESVGAEEMQGVKEEDGTEGHVSEQGGQQQQLQRQYASLDDLDEVNGMTPEQIIKTFTSRPPMLFTALHKVRTMQQYICEVYVLIFILFNAWKTRVTVLWHGHTSVNILNMLAFTN